VQKPITDEGSRDGLVVDESLLLESIQTRVDAGRSESLLPQPTLKLRAGTRSIGDEIQGGVTHADISVCVEQIVFLVRGQGVADPEPTALQRLEHDLEGLVVALYVDEDLEASRTQRLDAGDDGWLGHAESGAMSGRAMSECSVI